MDNLRLLQCLTKSGCTLLVFETDDGRAEPVLAWFVEFSVFICFFEPLSVVAVCLLASHNSEKARHHALHEFDLHESNERDSVTSGERWRGYCLVPDCGSFSERASKRMAMKERQKALNASENS